MSIETRREVGIAAAAFALFAVVFTWPVAARLGELGLVAVSAPLDSLIFLWNFHWVAESLASANSPFRTDQLFFPESVPLMLHTNTFLYGLLSLPVQAMFEGTRGLHIAFHLCILGSFTAAGLATWALARRLGLSNSGAFLAGVAFAFCGGRMTNLARLHVLCSEFLPIAMLAFHWTVEDRRLRGPATLAACMTALAYNSATLFTITLAGLFAAAPTVWRRRAPGWVGRVFGAAAVATVLAAPLIEGVVESLGWGGWRESMAAERITFSLDLAALLWPNANDLVLGSLLPVRPVSSLEQHFSFFVGLPVGLLVVAAVWLRSPVVGSGTWLAVAALGLVLAIGPEVKWLGEPRGIPLPYDLLEDWLLPLRVTRVPARFLVLTSLALALMAGGGFALLQRRLDLDRRAALAVCGVVAVVVALDGTDRFPLAMIPALEPDPSPLAAVLEPVPAEDAVLDLPYDAHFVGRVAMYYQTEHGHPILFAAYPRAPRSNRAHYEDSELFRLLSSQSASAMALAARLADLDSQAERDLLRGRGIGALVLHHDMYRTVGSRSVQQQMLARGRVLSRWLASEWGRPEHVTLGFYRATVFRL